MKADGGLEPFRDMQQGSVVLSVHVRSFLCACFEKGCEHTNRGSAANATRLDRDLHSLRLGKVPKSY